MRRDPPPRDFIEIVASQKTQRPRLAVHVYINLEALRRRRRAGVGAPVLSVGAFVVWWAALALGCRERSDAAQDETSPHRRYRRRIAASYS
jgi:hypothetical protein